MQCTYQKQDGSTCTREAMSDRGSCILHEDWELKSEEETDKIFYKEIEEGIGDFEGCVLFNIDLQGQTFEFGMDFSRSLIHGHATFLGSTVKGDMLFDEAAIDGGVWFIGSLIDGDISFSQARVGCSAWFTGATIKGEVSFDRARLKEWAMFDKAKIHGNARFSNVTIEGDASFEEAVLMDDVLFYRSDIHSLTFREARFIKMGAQEEASRTAKIIQERIGNRELADYHFYYEMIARRKQKNRAIKWLESPIQYIFGYGVKPFRVIVWWLSVVIVLAFVYWLGHGVQEATSFWEHLYFSVVNSATPGYGGYHPEPGVFQNLATFQAIFGTFMWAAFIVTFARKFMR